MILNLIFGIIIQNLFRRNAYLAFYEINRPEWLVSAYCDAYERGVDRYAALIEQGREVNPLEIRYYHQIKQCVAGFIASAANTERMNHPSEYARDRFKDVDPADREWLAERVAEIVFSLHEGNAIAWGVDRATWERYARTVTR